MPPRPEIDPIVAGTVVNGNGGVASTTTTGAIKANNHYGSIGNGNQYGEEDIEKMPLTSNLSMDDEAIDLEKPHKRRILKIIGWVLLTVAILSLAYYWVVRVVIDRVKSNTSIHTEKEEPMHHPSFQGKSDVNLLELNPITDLKLLSVDRSQTDASPSKIWGSRQGHGPLPTNSWYLNLISHKASQRPDDSTSVYTIPYIIDTAAAATGIEGMAGIRVHWPVLQASPTNIQMVDDYKNSLTIGTKGLYENQQPKKDKDGKTNGETTTQTPDVIPYRVLNDGKALSPLGVSLVWGGSDEDDDQDHKNNSTDITASATNNSTTNDDNSHNKPSMTTHIVRGMPYATMEYKGGLLPSLYSYCGLASEILVDVEMDGNTNGTSSQSSTLICSTHDNKDGGNIVTVQKELQLHFINSDFTWMVFFDKPVQVQCAMGDGDIYIRDFQLHVVGMGGSDAAKDDDDSKNNHPSHLTVRVALLDQCTTGKSSMKQHCTERARWNDMKTYQQLLKDHVGTYPTSPRLDIHYALDDDEDDNGSNNINRTAASTEDRTTQMTIDWAAKTLSSKDSSNNKNQQLLMFALPHHQELLQGYPNAKITDQCTVTFHGSTCLVLGSKWTLSENVGLPLSFWAPRPPQADMIPLLAKALNTDIKYRLAANLMRGAADTYFSGKILARYARNLVIADELLQLADQDISDDELLQKYSDVTDKKTLQDSRKAAASVKLPSPHQIVDVIQRLKLGVRAWLDSDAEAPFVYDQTWGGLVNCGCRYVGKDERGYCNNTFPDCPALVDVNEDFGNGYYNDHHYHYGYHLYAAAVAAKFDPTWARQHMEDVLLYIRDFANPSKNDPYFPPYRQKDWFLGSSWASGIVSAENSPHGRNEESSSEAISAYEAMTLFGSAMVEAYTTAWEDAPTATNSNNRPLQVAKLVREAGQLLTATELHATNRYWHVWSSKTHNSSFPEAYEQPVVGMLYDTMASFQTWFAPWAVVSYGIQLLPLTPVAERRDDPEWAALLYPKYKEACETAGDFCVENGWSILQAGLLATSGETESALKQALDVPSFVFETLGGMGNSLTNTIWFIATRKQQDVVSNMTTV